MILPIATACERAGITVTILADAIGMNKASCWDLLSHADELTGTLSLRQVLRAASVLGVAPLSLLPGQIVPARQKRPLMELIEQITLFCSERAITLNRFEERVGWDVQGVFAAPDTVLDAWNLDCLQDVCSALGLHWPDFLPDPYFIQGSEEA